MSRSYKKSPGFVDSFSGKKYFKRYFNKKVRHHENLSNGTCYKKINGTNPYDICDWRNIYFSKNEIIDRIKKWKNPPIHESWKRAYFHNDKIYKYYMK